MEKKNRASTLISLVGLLVSLTVWLFAQPAHAFCGFYVSGSGDGLYNNATRVALMRSGTRTVLTMSNDYKGPARDFAMVVPVPVVLQKENVRTLPHDIFKHIEALTAPRLVEYWEQDPCRAEDSADDKMLLKSAPMASMALREESGTAAVRIEAQFVVGEYEVVVLSADESTALERWLHENKYNIPQGAAEYLAGYVREQWKFFVARVNIEKVKLGADGSATLSPLRFHYDSPEFRLPVSLGLLNASDAQDLIVYVLSPTTRYETANYPNVFIPTNLDVTDTVSKTFPSFYAALFDRTVARNGGRAVVTEYSWSAGSCDPCPTPPLQNDELQSLGSDVLSTTSEGANWSPYNFIVTRMHTRYNRATLTEDLVFREADSVVGGREFLADANGGVEQGARVEREGMNNFQARYIIRHRWEGDVSCENPIRNQWGPPPGGAGSVGVQSALNLATVPRTGVELEKMVYTAVPEVGLDGFTPESPGRKSGRILVIALLVTLLALTAGSVLLSRRRAR